MGRKTSARHGGCGQLRVIGGLWRGRKLPVAQIEGLRPTSDPVRETLFNWLASCIPGARVLDCFCGTGALSIEALSRGAKEAVMVEKAASAARVLSENLQRLAADNAQVVNADSLLWLSRPAREPFDIIFLDPPFRKGLLSQTCALLQEGGYLCNETIVYIETEKELVLDGIPEDWCQFKEKIAGQVRYGLWHL